MDDPALTLGISMIVSSQPITLYGDLLSSRRNLQGNILQDPGIEIRKIRNPPEFILYQHPPPCHFNIWSCIPKPLPCAA